MMYKKTFILGGIFLGFLSGIIINYGHGETYKETDMQNVFIRFCTDGTGEKQLKYEDTVYVEPGKEKDICLYVMNSGPKKMMFKYGFTKSVRNSGGDRVCDSNMDTGNIFSSLIPSTQERTITIDPMTYQTIQEKIVIPPGMSGLQLGCLVYKLLTPEFSQVGGMFTLEIHKTTYLDIVVGGESSVRRDIKILDTTGSNLSNNKQVKVTVDNENDLSLSFLVKNQGNISENVTITGKIYNALGFQREFAIDPKELSPGTENEFIANIGILPAYKGFFTVKFALENDPKYMFPVTDEKLKQPGYMTGKVNIFIFSRIRVIALGIILLIAYRFFVPRKNNTGIVQGPTPTV